jgi:vitamin B12 transporter
MNVALFYSWFFNRKVNRLYNARQTILILILLLGNLVVSSQVILLDSVQIVAERPLDFELTKPIFKLSNSPTQHHQISTHLQRVTVGNVQMSSPGGLTTYLSHGLPARHFPIMWGDFNLLSSINGVIDLSLIPTALMGDVALYQTANLTSFQGQSIAGGLIMQGVESGMPKLKFTTEISSLQNIDLSTVYSYCNKNTIYSIGAQYGFRRNAFDYKLGNDKQKREPTNHQIAHITYDQRYFLASNQVLAWKLWLYDSDRSIINSITSNDTPQTQKDKGAKAMFSYRYDTEKYSYKISDYVGYEGIDFISPGIDSRAKLWVNQLGVELIENKNRTFTASLRWRYDLATPNFFLRNWDRNILQALSSKKIKISKNTLFAAHCGFDLINAKSIIPYGSVNLSHDKLSIRAAYTYQLPSFNDLYWPQGGNADLKTEKAWQISSDYKIGGVEKFATLSIFSHLVDNWILWTPGSNGIWSPENIQNVLSTGTKLTLHYEKKYKKLTWLVNGEFNYLSAKIRQHKNKDIIGNQLNYIPQLQAILSNKVQIKKHSLLADIRFVGKRFDSPDMSSNLDPYTIIDIHYSYKISNHRFDFGIENVLNSAFETVRFYPMPGRVYRIQFTYLLN